MSRIVTICDTPGSASVAQTDANVGGTHQAVACVAQELRKLGHSVDVVSAGELFDNIPQNHNPYSLLTTVLDSLNFDTVHIATQSRIGFLARRYCVARKLAFSTAYHTQYPEWMYERHGVPTQVTYAYIRWFCRAATTVIVPTPSMALRLAQQGVKNTVSNLHGVDTERFKPGDKSFLTFPRPIWLYVGRVMVEKNPEAFLALNLPGTKVVVGDGNLQVSLQERYPETKFVGIKTGTELAQYYRASDVFVFPSLTDTFGLVMLEALASGVPVAAYPVTGPLDVITDPGVGCMDKDLSKAAMNALRLSSDDCRNFALRHSWEESAQRFLSFQTPCHSANSAQRHSPSRLWLERKLNLPMVLGYKVVERANEVMFGSEAQK